MTGKCTDTNTVFTVNLEVREGLKKPFTFTLQAGLKGLQGSDTGLALWGIAGACEQVDTHTAVFAQQRPPLVRVERPPFLRNSRMGESEW